VAFGLGLATLYLLFRFKAPYPNLRIWLAIVLVTFCGALFLGTSSGSRFTVGWYAGRSSGFISGLVLFLFLLGEALSQQQKALQGARLQRAQALRLQIETERRAQSEARLVQAQKLEAIGQLSGGIAHDFNNLLAAIVGGLELLKRSAELTPKQTKWIDGALSAAHRGAKLTKQLLIFSRGQRLELKPVVVAELALGMRELLARTLGPQIEVEMRFENSNAAAMSEPTQLELAILNLAVNARDAMPEGGKLLIGTRATEIENDQELKDGAYLELSVADGGSGMAPEIAAKAFDPFFTTKAAGKGAGLGLAQVAEIAHRAGGAARIESAVGKGTVVRVFLPIVDLFAPEAVAPNLGLSVQASGADVLVIDDDAAVREIMVGMLTALGASVREAADGEHGLAMIDEEEPDLVVVDFAMPRMNGAEVARAARLRHPDLRIVFVTGYADSDAIERATGPHAFILRKPFRDAEFQAILAEALSTKAAA
jgi:signal transduction histidine kinase/CheY-like chemotaxis protein